MSETSGRVDEACFRYTQAYVYALECGDKSCATAARARLLAFDREE